MLADRYCFVVYSSFARNAHRNHVIANILLPRSPSFPVNLIVCWYPGPAVRPCVLGLCKLVGWLGLACDALAQAVQCKGGAGDLGMLGTLSSTLHLTNELQGTATVVNCRRRYCSDRRRFVFDLTSWLRYSPSISKGFRRFPHLG